MSRQPPQSASFDAANPSSALRKAAVVADEVRHLSGRTNQFSQEIRTKVANVHESVAQVLGHLVPDAPGSGEFLAFRLGPDEYGIDVLKVQEIRGYDAVTRTADAPEFIKGVTDLRGIAVPIVDLRIKFELGRADYDQFTAVVILSLANRVVGIVVDSVSDVVSVTREHVRQAPETGSGFGTRYVLGIAALERRRLILVDIERLMCGAEMGFLDTLNE